MEFITLIFSVLYFIVAAFLAFYVPGRVLLGKVSFPKLATLACSIVIGVVMWAFQAIIFGYLGQRELSYVYLLVFLVLFIYKKHYSFSYKTEKRDIDWISVALIIIGALGQSLLYIRMGWVSMQGVIIEAHNNVDHIWHAALVNELIQRFPPNEPSIAGVKLYDYHYLYNLVSADLILIFHLPFFTAQFMGMYFIPPFLLGILIFYISKIIYPSKFFTRLYLFFIYFSGNAAGWYMLIFHGSFNWNLSSLINDASKFMDSPPYGYAVILGLTGLYLVLMHKNAMSKRLIILCALTFGSMLEYKVYVGIPFLLGLGMYSLVQLKQRKFWPFIICLLAGVVAFTLFKSDSSQSAGLVFLPFDIPRDFINQPLLHLTDWQLRWVIYQAHHNIPRIIEYGLMMSGVYLVIQFGVQLLGLFPYPKTVKKLGWALSLFVFTESFSAIIIGLLFYQTVGGANIWEFFLASTPFLSLVLTLSLVLYLEKRPKLLQGIVIGIVVLIVSPQWIMSQVGYVQQEYFTPFHGVTTTQAASYNYLSTKTPKQAVIFLANAYTPYTAATVANLFANRQLYFSGLGVRQIKTPEILKRETQVATVTNGNNALEIRNIIKSAHVSYVYYYAPVLNQSTLLQSGLHIVFTNSAATIFKVE